MKRFISLLRTILIKVIPIIVLCSIAIIFFIIAYWAFYPTEAPIETGFDKYNEAKSGPRGKTLWDWMNLLVVPVLIALTAWSFKEIEKRNTQSSERERAQNETLDSFIKIMTELIINNKLISQTPSPESKIIARTRIMLALSNLDRMKKGQVLQFLFESSLINQEPKINLNGGDIKNAVLDGIVLSSSEIKGAYFNKASIKNSNLSNANFTSCNFSEANFSNSLMENTDLSYSNLTSAKLRNINLDSINFEGAVLTKADLRGSSITQNQLDSILDKNKNGIKLTKKLIK